MIVLEPPTVVKYEKELLKKTAAVNLFRTVKYITIKD